MGQVICPSTSELNDRRAPRQRLAASPAGIGFLRGALLPLPGRHGAAWITGAEPGRNTGSQQCGAEGWGEGTDADALQRDAGAPGLPRGPGWKMAWSLRVQGVKVVPWKHQTGARLPVKATNPVQPSVAAAARAAANRSRQRVSDRPGLGTCGARGLHYHWTCPTAPGSCPACAQRPAGNPPGHPWLPQTAAPGLRTELIIGYFAWSPALPAVG